MKKILCFIILSVSIFSLYSQNYLISFAGSGASTSIDSVRVRNITQCTSVKLLSGDVLNLMGVVGVSDFNADQGKGILIYPNPMTEKSTIEVFTTNAAKFLIEIYDITGKKIQQTEKLLITGKHTFSIEGLLAGTYILRITSDNYLYTSELVCTTNGSGRTEITYTGSDSSAEFTNNIKSSKALVSMQYTTGDRLLLIGYSGNYATINMLIPTGNSMVSFNFIAATDGDNNNYPVVQIGTQKWIGKNLQTTQYNDGSSIPLVTTGSAWSALTTPGYCIYGNNNASIPKYGMLYNWYVLDNASNGNKNACPVGWHVSTETEWNTLITFLGGETVAGGKLKTNCTNLWTTPNTGASNEFGFSAAPGGFRDNSGVFDFAGSYGQYWTSTGYSGSTAWMFIFGNNNADLISIDDFKKDGFSVRCVKD